MGACTSAHRPTNIKHSSALATSSALDVRQPSLNRKSYTLRSPTNHSKHINTPSPENILKRNVSNGLGRRRQNSLTVAARTNLQRTPISTLATSSSYSGGGVSLNLSEITSSSCTLSEAHQPVSQSSVATAAASSDVLSSNDVTIELVSSPATSTELVTLPELVSSQATSPDTPLVARSPNAAQPTARERLYGTFDHRSSDFKAFYSRPEAFRYENSPFFRTVAKHFHPNMKSDILEGTISKHREFVLHSSDVQVPEGDCENQWFGKHVVHFYNSISVFYFRISRLCTAETCPKMHAGPRVEYKWQNDKGEIRTVSAPRYIKLLFAWIDKQISDPNVFPVPKSKKCLDKLPTTLPYSHETAFPEQFRAMTTNILRRLWRVIAHLYYGHFKRIRAIGLEDELNFRFYHLAFFALEFDLLSSAELRPLRSLIVMRLPEHLSSGIPW